MPGSCCLPVLCADHQRVCAAGRAWDSCSCYLPFTIHWWGLHAGEAPLCQRLGQPQRHVHPCVLAQLWMDQATRNMIEQDKYQLHEPFGCTADMCSTACRCKLLFLKTVSQESELEVAAASQAMLGMWQRHGHRQMR